MQGIFQKENTDKALKYGIYRHLPTYEKIIRNLVSFYSKEFSGIVCIIGQNSKHPQHFLQVIHQVASTIVESCKNNVLSLNIGIGSLADSIWKLPVSFASASHSLKYLFFFPHKNIFDAREALGKELNLLSFSENTDEELIRLICSKVNAP